MFVETLEDVEAAGVGPRLFIPAANLSSCLEAMRCSPEGPGPTAPAACGAVGVSDSRGGLHSAGHCCPHHGLSLDGMKEN